jgi:hypothetical protein
VGEFLFGAVANIVFGHFLFLTGFVVLKAVSVGRFRFQAPDALLPELNFKSDAEGLPPIVTILAGLGFWSALVALIVICA